MVRGAFFDVDHNARRVDTCLTKLGDLAIKDRPGLVRPVSEGRRPAPRALGHSTPVDLTVEHRDELARIASQKVPVGISNAIAVVGFHPLHAPPGQRSRQQEVALGRAVRLRVVALFTLLAHSLIEPSQQIYGTWANNLSTPAPLYTVDPEYMHNLFDVESPLLGGAGDCALHRVDRAAAGCLRRCDPRCRGDNATTPRSRR
ncbi:MAG: hypothetical protein LC808_06170, partial [Actinobacteria bacterium]|nr:hypothetical protein [Actinomycetota bacterium]